MSSNSLSPLTTSNIINNNTMSLNETIDTDLNIPPSIDLLKWEDPDILNILLPEPYHLIDNILRNIIINVLDEIKRKDSEDISARIWENTKSVFPSSVITDIQDVTANTITSDGNYSFIGNSKSKLIIINQETGKRLSSTEIKFNTLNTMNNTPILEPIISLSVASLTPKIEIDPITNEAKEVLWFTLSVCSLRVCNIFRISNVNWGLHLCYQYVISPSETFPIQVPSGLLKVSAQSLQISLADDSSISYEEAANINTRVNAPSLLSVDSSLKVLSNPLLSPPENIQIPLIIVSSLISLDNTRLFLSLLDGSVRIFDIIKLLPSGHLSRDNLPNYSDASLLTAPLLVEPPKLNQNDTLLYLKDLNSKFVKCENMIPSQLSVLLSSLTTLSTSQLIPLFFQSKTNILCLNEAIIACSKLKTTFFEKQIAISSQNLAAFWSSLSPVLLLQLFICYPNVSIVYNIQNSKKYSSGVRVSWSSRNILSTYILPYLDSTCFDANFVPEPSHILPKRADVSLKLLPNHQFSESITAMTNNSNGDLFAVGLQNGTVILLDTIANCHIKVFERHQGAVSSLYLYNNLFLVSTSIDGTIHVFCLDSIKLNIGKEQFTTIKRTKPFPAPISCITGLDGFPLAFVGLVGFETVFVLDLLTGDIIGQLECSSDPMLIKKNLTKLLKSKEKLTNSLPHMVMAPRSNVTTSNLDANNNETCIVLLISSVSHIPIISSNGGGQLSVIGWKMNRKDLSSSKTKKDTLLEFNSNYVIEEESYDFDAGTPGQRPDSRAGVNGSIDDIAGFMTPRSQAKETENKSGRWLLFSSSKIIQSLFPAIANASNKYKRDAKFLFNLVTPSLRHSAAAFDFLEETEMDANILSLHNSKAKEVTTPRKDSAKAVRKSTSSRLSKPSATQPHSGELAPSFHNPFTDVDKETSVKGTNDFHLKIEKLLKEQSSQTYHRESKIVSRLGEVATQLEELERKAKMR